MVGIRDTDLGIASHQRLVYRNMIEGLRSAFDEFYNRDRQLQDLRITQNYPIKKIDYPSVVVDYQPQRVVNAGVGHVEWFTSPSGYWRKWKHSRFEGHLALHVFALSTLDRDIISDAIAEIIRFGDLDQNLNRFYEVIYKDDEALEAEADAADALYSESLFGQLMLDSDQLTAVGNSATVAPWEPEDVLVYSGGWSMALHGGYYNSYPTQDWSRVTSIRIQAFAIDHPYGPVPVQPSAEADFSWVSDDEATVFGQSVIAGGEAFTDAP